MVDMFPLAAYAVAFRAPTHSRRNAT